MLDSGDDDALMSTTIVTSWHGGLRWWLWWGVPVYECASVYVSVYVSESDGGGRGERKWWDKYSDCPLSNCESTVQQFTLRQAERMDLNSFLRCTQLNAPCTGLWQGDLQERMRRCFGLFLSTAVMTHRAPSPMWGLPASSTVGPFFFFFFFFCQPSLTPAGVLSFHPNPVTSFFHSLLESFC